MGKISSYQKLKQRNKYLQEEINKILDEPEYYVTRSIERKVILDCHKALWSGSGVKPSGEIKYFDSKIFSS